MREALFRAKPLCAHCEPRGVTALAVIRDHIIPLAEGGEDVEENTQGLCAKCNKVKTDAESRRGSAKARGGSNVAG